MRRGFKRATVATAHKMLRVIFCVLTTRTPYCDPETDYEARRSGTRGEFHGRQPALRASTA